MVKGSRKTHRIKKCIFHSEQMNREIGGNTRITRVFIDKNKAFKEVEKIAPSGKLLHKSRKTLKKSEINLIRRNVFIRGLFNDCE
jgi:ADP-glucose pyrophosphorylase